MSDNTLRDDIKREMETAVCSETCEVVCDVTHRSACGIPTSMAEKMLSTPTLSRILDGKGVLSPKDIPEVDEWLKKQLPRAATIVSMCFEAQLACTRAEYEKKLLEARKEGYDKGYAKAREDMPLIVTESGLAKHLKQEGIRVTIKWYNDYLCKHDNYPTVDDIDAFLKS